MYALEGFVKNVEIRPLCECEFVEIASFSSDTPQTIVGAGIGQNPVACGQEGFPHIESLGQLGAGAAQILSSCIAFHVE